MGILLPLAAYTDVICGPFQADGYCLEGEGDCDKHSECRGDLLCGYGHCNGFDCCRAPTGDEGKACYDKDECGGDLVCGNDGRCR